MATRSLKHFSLADADWTRWSGPLARVLSILLGLLSLWLAVRLVLLLLSGPDVRVTVPDARQTGARANTAPVDISRWHLFGRAAVSQPIALSSLPETPLDLQLSGIVSGVESDQEGHAIIIDGSGRQWVYKVGDEVPGGARVKAITPQQVVLTRNGRDETLSLPSLLRAGQEGSTALANNRPSPAAGDSLVNRAPNQLVGLRGQPRNTASITVPTGALANGLSGAPLNNVNFQRLSQSVQVTPVNGGYKVFPGRNATLFGQLGLQANDVITAVNGQALSSPQAAMRLFQNLDSSSGVTISVRRGGQVIQLQPDLSAIQGQ